MSTGFDKKSEKPLNGVNIYRGIITGYSLCMTLYEYYAVFPDGEIQEIAGPIAPNALVDVNATPHTIPLATIKTLAYRVAVKRTFEDRGVVETRYLLEQLTADELIEYT